MELLTRDELPGLFHQRLKHSQGFFLQPDSQAVLAEFAGFEVSFERPKANLLQRSRCVVSICHFFLP